VSAVRPRYETTGAGGTHEEFHPIVSVADQPVRSNASPTQIRDHDREILRMRAQQLEAELSIGHTGMQSGPANPESHLHRGVPCSCGGSNENCYRCFGVGVIGGNRPSEPASKYKYVSPHRKRRTRPIVPAQQVEHRIQRVETKSRRTPNGPVQCLVCRELVRATVLGLHYSARHSGRKLICEKEIRQWVTCPVCNTFVKRLEKHMRRHEQKAVGRGAPAGGTSERERLIRLGRIVPEQQPTQLAAARPATQGARNTLKMKPVTTGRSGALERWKEDLTRKENPNSPKNLDYTRPYPLAYRENGRYGSHPSHDGFDDESTS